MAPRDFTVQPASMLTGLKSVTGGIEAMIGKEQEEAQEAETKTLTGGLMGALRSQDPDKVFDYITANPKALAIADTMGKFVSDVTKQDKIDTAKRILVENANPAEAMAQHAQTVANEGGDPTQTIEVARAANQDPQVGVRQAEIMLALYAPEEYTAYKKTTAAAEPAKGTANIKDWNHYQKLLKTDPTQAEQFARQVGITDEEKERLKPTVAMQNYDRWETMTEGVEKTAFGKMIGIDPKASPAENRKQMEKLEADYKEVENADTTIGMVQDLLANDEYINALVGVRGATPFAVPGGVGFDATVAFEQLKNSLTLDNLNKMSGVLSDSDIKILQSAGAGLEPGMSEKALRNRLQQIRTVLMKKTERTRGRLTAMGYKGNADGKAVADMTDAELMESAFGGKK